MAISIQCPGCKKKLKAKDELAGKRVKCPGCGQSIAISATQAPSGVAALAAALMALPPAAARSSPKFEPARQIADDAAAEKLASEVFNTPDPKAASSVAAHHDQASCDLTVPAPTSTQTGGWSFGIISDLELPGQAPNDKPESAEHKQEPATAIPNLPRGYYPCPSCGFVSIHDDCSCPRCGYRAPIKNNQSQDRRCPVSLTIEYVGFKGYYLHNTYEILIDGKSLTKSGLFKALPIASAELDLGCHTIAFKVGSLTIPYSFSFSQPGTYRARIVSHWRSYECELHSPLGIQQPQRAALDPPDPRDEAAGKALVAALLLIPATIATIYGCITYGESPESIAAYFAAAGLAVATVIEGGLMVALGDWMAQKKVGYWYDQTKTNTQTNLDINAGIATWGFLFMIFGVGMLIRVLYLAIVG